MTDLKQRKEKWLAEEEGVWEKAKLPFNYPLANPYMLQLFRLIRLYEAEREAFFQVNIARFDEPEAVEARKRAMETNAAWAEILGGKDG